MLCAGMKVVFTALLDCLPTVVAVVMLSFLFYITFAILGVGLFMGQFYRCDCGGDWGKPERNCTDPDWESLNMTACEAQGGAWENPPFNFDNILPDIGLKKKDSKNDLPLYFGRPIVD